MCKNSKGVSVLPPWFVVVSRLLKKKGLPADPWEHGAWGSMGLGCGSGCVVGTVGRSFTWADPLSSMSTVVSSSGEEFSRYCKPACRVGADWLQLAWPLWDLQKGSCDVLPNVTWQPCHEDAQDCGGGKQEETDGLDCPVCLARCQIWQAHGEVLILLFLCSCSLCLWCSFLDLVEPRSDLAPVQAAACSQAPGLCL